MKIGFIMPAIALAVATTVSSTLLAVTPSAYSQEVGVYDSGTASYKAAFSIENYTGVTIHYKVRWGNENWKVITLPSGSVGNHTYSIGDGATEPTPYIRFDKIAGDGNNYTRQQYRLQFHRTGYAGYGGKQNSTQPKRYFFQFGADGRSLDLLTR